MGAVFQGGQRLGIVASFPAVKCFTTDPEVATGQGSVPAVVLVVIEPRRPPLSRTAQLGRAPLQVPGAGQSCRHNSHGDTLFQVSRIILNEHTYAASQGFPAKQCWLFAREPPYDY